MRAKGMTLVDVLVVVIIMVLLFVILLPGLSRARELSRRSQCFENLKIVGTAIEMYKTCSRYTYPLIHDVGMDPTTLDEKSFKTDDRMPFGASDGESASDAKGDWGQAWEQNLFLLVSGSYTTEYTFLCPSNPNHHAADRSGYTKDGRPILQFGFAEPENISYGIQIAVRSVTMTEGESPQHHAAPFRDNMDGLIAIMADTGQYRAMDGSGLLTDGLNSDKPFLEYRSGNHGREGESVLFAGSSAKFTTNLENRAGADGNQLYQMDMDDSGRVTAGQGWRPAKHKRDSVIVWAERRKLPE